MRLAAGNGGDGTYSAAIAIWAMLVPGTLAQWTAAAIAAGHRVDPTRRVLRLKAVLALAAAAMLALTAARAVVATPLDDLKGVMRPSAF